MMHLPAASRPHDATALRELFTAIYDETATADQLHDFEDILRQEDEATDYFSQLVQLHVLLEEKFSMAQPHAEWVGLPAGSDDAIPSAAIVDPLPPLAFVDSSSQGTVGYLSGWPVAYLIATVVFGIGLVVGAFTYVSHPGNSVVSGQWPVVSESNPQSLIPNPSSIVGRITGMADCQWDGSGFRVRGSEESGQRSATRGQRLQSTSHYPLATNYSVSLGDRIALKSGLLEITYNTGAKVILQGPVTYEVESPASGYLSHGKLTARLEKRGEGRGERGEASIQHLFVVRTPTAMVTDLGTEFGVEVSADQTANVCVFEGTVEVVQAGASRKRTGSSIEQPMKRLLVAGQALRLEAADDPKPLPTASIGAAFVRTLPAGHAMSQSDPLQQGLVAYWSFDDASNLGRNLTGGGNLTAHKTASQEPAGVIGGALRVRGDARIAPLLFQDGQGVPKGIPTGDASYSLSAWCRVDAVPPKDIFDIVGWGESKCGCANALILYGMPQDQCMVRNFWWDNDIPAFVGMTSIVGGWHHLVATYNHRGRMQYLYLDGVRNALRAVEQRPNISANSFAVGRRHKGLEPKSPTQWVGGLLDEVGIWDRELSEPEIARLYNNGKGFNPLALVGSAADSGAAQPAAEKAKGGATANTGR